LFHRGRVSLTIALAFLAAALAVGEQVARHFPDSRLAVLLREGMLIVGWVAMWRPIEIFLYDWWPIRAEWRLFERLVSMPVRIEYRSAASRDAAASGDAGRVGHAGRDDWPGKPALTRAPSIRADGPL
jgi:hypothetical protein